MKKLLIIGLHWPEPDTNAAAIRILQLVDFFKSLNYEIYFCSTVHNPKRQNELEELEIYTQQINLNNDNFNTYLQKVKPNTILFDRFITEEQFGWRVREVLPNSFTILDTEDLHFLRKSRKKAHTKNETINLFNQETYRELASIYRCDLSLIISKKELKILHKLDVPKRLVHYLPFLEEEIDKEEQAQIPSFENRNNFLFIGNFLHEPNWNAALHLKKKIWPKIHQQIPEAELHIYGGNCSKKVYELNQSKEKFLVKGWIKSSKEVHFRTKISLAPLLFGAGLKGKLIDTMKYGCPNITTTIGAEGMGNSKNWNGYITTSDEEFIEKAIFLYQNQKEWDLCQQKGYKILHKRFSKNKFYKKLESKINQIQTNLETHRNKTIFRQILQLQNLQAQRYLSRWIMEKNREK